MPKRSSTSPSSDPSIAAFRAVDKLTGGNAEPAKPRPKKKNPAAVALGRKGGKIGGRRRAEVLTEDRKREIARQAATARWARREP